MADWRAPANRRVLLYSVMTGGGVLPRSGRSSISRKNRKASTKQIVAATNTPWKAPPSENPVSRAFAAITSTDWPGPASAAEPGEEDGAEGRDEDRRAERPHEVHRAGRHAHLVRQRPRSGSRPRSPGTACRGRRRRGRARRAPRRTTSRSRRPESSTEQMIVMTRPMNGVCL